MCSNFPPHSIVNFVFNWSVFVDVTSLENQIKGQNKVVFMSERDGNFEIYTMNADGTSQTRTFEIILDKVKFFAHIENEQGEEIAFVELYQWNLNILVNKGDTGFENN